MMRSNSLLKIVVPFLLVSALSLLGGWGIAQYGLDFRYLLFLVLLIAMIAIIAMGKRALQVGFVFWIWMFLLGYRTVYLTTYFHIHPLIIFLVPLFLILLFSLRNEKNINDVKLPAILWVFSIFWIWGFITGVSRGLSWANMIADALNFFFIIPLFLIIFYLSNTPGFWKSATITFLASGTLICFFGILEFYSPQFRNFLPGLIQANSEGLSSFSGFTRASFAFWGAAPAVIVSALALPMVWLVSEFYTGWISKSSAFIFVVILCIGIYISGTRAAWLMVFVASILLAYFAFNISGIFLSAVFWFIASRFFSAEVWSLILSIYIPATSGQIVDSGIQIRFNRQQDAFHLAVNNPLGVGWSGSGWVHGDFTQVAANLGILAGIIFLIWYFQTLYRAWKTYRKNPKDRIFQAILTSFVLCGIILATEGAQVLAQYIMPVWFIWALMEAYLQQKSMNPEIK